MGGRKGGVGGRMGGRAGEGWGRCESEDDGLFWALSCKLIPDNSPR